ncbi:TIGR02594 family protein [Rhizobium fabae]|uniref:N-acetylmuramoyl-L-alanine amidase n=1 Tax=Rhizobium fabae TaxID=573179 RepID=A0A7W6FLQ1_9HYPH|nr:TIGR02594 family protein [Rhizobium fabae]MBB3918397.1 uncharacterized protein (TIGR02594 family) [Rhizobium fabae]RUM08521.1 TIGR02594 family protein [Rhizobium fabae]
MHKVIDSPWELGHCANALKAAGVETVIRYYNHSNSTRLPQKRIERAEYDDILEAGLSLAVVFQQRGGAGGNIGDLDAESGVRDSDRALALAETNGQPENSAIYFAVDHDYYKAADLASIKAYFGAVSSALRGKYRVGVYGSGTVGRAVRDAGFVDFIWLAAATGWSGTRDMLNTDQWALYQVVPPLAFQGVSYDGNIVGGKWKDFGQFRADAEGAIALGASREFAAAIERHSELAEVSATGGLNLRRGPGESFAVERALPLGTPVTILERNGDWAKVDLDGDGTVDGYMHASFLKVMAGGFPIEEAIGRTLYDVARAELERGVAEVSGGGNNPRIVMYHKSTNHWSGTDDSVAWCSSFVNFCVEQAGMIGTDRQDARSWKDWGDDVTENAREGDIAVFARGPMSGSDGHVGFLVADEGGPTVKILGGNQSNRVCYQTYPKDGNLGSTRYRLLGIRRG